MEDALTISEKFKEEGNASLKANQFQKAVDLYTKAIDNATTEGSRVPNNKIAIYYANRAFAHIKLENYGLTIPDAENSIKNNPDYEKAYLRLAFAKEVLQSYKEAYGAYLKAFEISGKKDQFIYQKLADCKRQSDEAIKNKRQTMLHDQKQRTVKAEKAYKNWRQIEVQKQYDGLRLQQKEQVTSQWY